MKDAALFDQIGADKLRAVISDFYDRVFGDVMIGFMFEGKNKQHLIDREYEFAASFLGAPDVKYTGRPLRAAHAQHTIFGGHFERRLQILREAMAAHDVPQPVRDAWIAHTDALRAQITRDPGSECATTSEAAAKVEWVAPDAPIKLGRK